MCHLGTYLEALKSEKKLQGTAAPALHPLILLKEALT
jgi:hypothetical protein